MSTSARASSRHVTGRRLIGSSLVVVLTSVAAARASAQQTLSADLGFGIWKSATTSTAASVLGVNASQSLPGWRMEGSLAMTTFGERPGASAPRLSILHLRAASDTIRLAGLRGALALGLDRDPYDSTFGRAQLALVPSLAVGGRGVMAWVSVSPTRSFARGATPNGLESEVGATATRGRVLVSLSALRRQSQQMSDIVGDSSGVLLSSCRLIPNGPTRCLRRVSSTSVDGRMATTLQGVEVDVRGGVLLTALRSPTDAPAQRWAVLRVGAPVQSNVTLIAQLGAEPPNVVRQLPMRTTFALGLRIRARDGADHQEQPTVGRSAPIEVGPLEANGERALRLQAPGARQVDLRGDITGWKSVPLTRGHGGLWELRLRVEPGVHYLVVRHDGGPWQVLRGLPLADDDFGEAVSVLVVDGESAVR